MDLSVLRLVTVASLFFSSIFFLKMDLSSITLYETEIYLKIEEYRLFSDLIFGNSIYPYTGSMEGLNLLIEKNP